MEPKVSDERLNAYVDNEATPDEAARIDQGLEEGRFADEIARLRRVDALLSEAFVAPRDVPDDLVAVMDVAQARWERHPLRRLGALWGKACNGVAGVASGVLTPGRGAGLPIAASLCVGAFVVMALLVPNATRDKAGDVDLALIEPGGTLFPALESTPSSVFVALGGGESARPVLSFLADDGRYCRELEVNSGRSVWVSVACREDAGWRIEIQLEAEAQDWSGQGYVPVSGYDSAALDAAYDRLGYGDVLSAGDEGERLELGWGRVTPLQ